MGDTRKSARGVAALVMPLLLVLGCSSSDSGPGNEVSGFVVKANVAGATVEALRFLDTGAIQPFSPAATATTATDGTFTVDVGSYTGAVILMATGGTYADEATGNTNSLPADPVLMGMATAADGTVTGQLTPLTHWAAVLARTLAAEPSTDAALAMTNAVTMVEDYFGVANLLTAMPADLTAGAVPPGNTAEHAAAIAGLSQLADDQGFADPVELVEALAKDGADGRFDGEQRGTTTLPWAEMGGAKLRDAIRDFLDTNARNQSGLASTDVATDEAIDAHIGLGDSAYLWPPRIGAMSLSGGTTAGGTAMKLTGDGIDTGSGVDVRFGNTAAAITNSDLNSVEVTTPAAAAEGRVSIEIVNLELGLVTRLEKAFQYFTPGTPSIDRISPSHGPTAGGALIEIYGSRFDATSTVEVGGVAAPVVQAAYPGLLVARAPARVAGTAQVRVRNGGLTSNTAAFEYRNRDVGQDLGDADLAGGWMLYRLGHDYSAGSSYYAARTSMTLDGNGGISYSESRRTASPGNLTGTQTTDNGSYDYVAVQDGTLLLNLNPGATSPANFEFLRATMQDDADVFVGARTERPFVTELAVGVRRGSGMNNGDLIGAYWLAGSSQQYSDAGGGRTAVTVVGHADFDGAGSGSVAVLVTVRSTGDDAYIRSLEFATFTYSVASDGNLTMTIDNETTLLGTVAEAGDFAVAVEQGTSGELGMFLLTKQGNGLLPSSMAGSWYGGDLAQMFSGTDSSEHEYISDRFRALTDVAGLALFEAGYSSNTDTDPAGEAGEWVEAGFAFVSPAGYVSDDSSLFELVGVLGNSRRFLLVAPAYPMGDQGAQDEQLLGLLVRNRAYYSQGSLDQQYNSATLSHLYGSPQSPPVADEEAGAWVGEMTFAPTAPAILLGQPFLASGTVFSPGGTRKRWKKTPGGAGDTDQVLEPDFNGGYAIAGDGRVYVFRDAPPPTLLAQVEGGIDVLIGQTTPHGEAAMLRTGFWEGVPTNVTVLTRKTAVAPPLSGDYFLCEVGIGLDLGTTPIQTTARVARGVITLADPVPGSFTGSLDFFERWEDDTEANNSDPAAAGTYVVNADGTVTVTPAGGTPLGGIATPDGAAMFLVDDDLNSPRVSLTVLVRRNLAGTGVDTAGSFAISSVGYELFGPATFPPAAEAEVDLAEALVRTNGTVDGAFLLGIRANTEAVPLVAGTFNPSMVLTVAGDGGLALVVSGFGPTVTRRGGVSSNGRYACLVEGDAQPDDTLLSFYMRR